MERINTTLEDMKSDMTDQSRSEQHSRQDEKMKRSDTAVRVHQDEAVQEVKKRKKKKHEITRSLHLASMLTLHPGASCSIKRNICTAFFT